METATTQKNNLANDWTEHRDLRLKCDAVLRGTGETVTCKTLINLSLVHTRFLVIAVAAARYPRSAAGPAYH